MCPKGSNHKFCYLFSLRVGVFYAAAYVLVNYAIIRTGVGIWMLMRSEALPDQPGKFKTALKITGCILLSVAALGLATFICLCLGLWKHFRHYFLPAVGMMLLIFLTEIATSVYSITYWNLLHHEHVLQAEMCPYRRTRIVKTPTQEEVNFQTYTAMWNLATTCSAFYLCCVVYNYQAELRERQLLNKTAEYEHSKAWAGAYHFVAWSRDKK